ncbi:MAG: hypothetical protein ACFFBP_09940 [Promethearchaeota archaeon]
MPTSIEPLFIIDLDGTCRSMVLLFDLMKEKKKIINELKKIAKETLKNKEIKPYSFKEFTISLESTKIKNGKVAMNNINVRMKIMMIIFFNFTNLYSSFLYI